VVSIALLSLVRRFIILDLYQTTPSLIAALAGAALALGIVFWLVSNREEPQEVEAQEDSSNPTTLNKLQRRRISATDNTNSSSMQFGLRFQF
jgi:hypothetical protein